MNLKEAALLTGRIEAMPTIMFAWHCPKCGALHMKVNREGGPSVVHCINPKCKEKFDRSQFRFNHETKIAKILADMRESMYIDAVKDREKELMKAEVADALTS